MRNEKGQAEHKTWHALASEAATFYSEHGYALMNAEDSATYERMIRQIRDATGHHDEARGQQSPRSWSDTGAVMGRCCDNCGLDESATSFPWVGDDLLPGYDAADFCNSCGTVYNQAGYENPRATALFKALGSPGFTGS